MRKVKIQSLKMTRTSFLEHFSILMLVGGGHYLMFKCDISDDVHKKRKCLKINDGDEDYASSVILFLGSRFQHRLLD